MSQQLACVGPQQQPAYTGGTNALHVLKPLYIHSLCFRQQIIVLYELLCSIHCPEQVSCYVKCNAWLWCIGTMPSQTPIAHFQFGLKRLFQSEVMCKAIDIVMIFFIFMQ